MRRKCKVFIEFAHADPPELLFEEGSPRMASLGTRGSWRVQGHGLHPAHVLLRFDGRRLHLKALGPVVLNNEPVGDDWVIVPPRSSLKIGPVVWGRFVVVPPEEAHAAVSSPSAAMAMFPEDDGLEAEDTEISTVRMQVPKPTCPTRYVVASARIRPRIGVA